MIDMPFSPYSSLHVGNYRRHLHLPSLMWLLRKRFLSEERQSSLIFVLFTVNVYILKFTVTILQDTIMLEDL